MCSNSLTLNGIIVTNYDALITRVILTEISIEEAISKLSEDLKYKLSWS